VNEQKNSSPVNMRRSESKDELEKFFAAEE
jgi:hypothetical protein